jgi:hypothetical protein
MPWFNIIKYITVNSNTFSNIETSVFLNHCQCISLTVCKWNAYITNDRHTHMKLLSLYSVLVNCIFIVTHSKGTWTTRYRRNILLSMMTEYKTTCLVVRVCIYIYITFQSTAGRGGGEELGCSAGTASNCIMLEIECHIDITFSIHNNLGKCFMRHMYITTSIIHWINNAGKHNFTVNFVSKHFSVHAQSEFEHVLNDLSVSFYGINDQNCILARVTVLDIARHYI